MDKKIRLILDGPRSATLNMAIDEALMESQKSEAVLPVLRIYFWDKPSCSLGYFQDIRSIAKNFNLPQQGMAVVKRMTGGGMVMHGKDLTFSLALKNPNSFLPSETKASYLKVNEALMVGFRKKFPGIDFADCKSIPSARGKGERICFDQPSCYDLLLEGKKIVGASQRRRDGVMLHQATIFLNEEKEALILMMLDGFKSKWGAEFEIIPLTADEILLAKTKEEERYSSPEWACPVFV